MTKNELFNWREGELMAIKLPPTYCISTLIMFVFTQNQCHTQNVTQGQFLSRVQLVQIQSFPSPRLVA